MVSSVSICFFCFVFSPSVERQEEFSDWSNDVARRQIRKKRAKLKFSSKIEKRFRICVAGRSDSSLLIDRRRKRKNEEKCKQTKNKASLLCRICSFGFSRQCERLISHLFFSLSRALGTEEEVADGMLPTDLREKNYTFEMKFGLYHQKVTITMSPISLTMNTLREVAVRFIQTMVIRLVPHHRINDRANQCPFCSSVPIKISNLYIIEFSYIVTNRNLIH